MSPSPSRLSNPDGPARARDRSSWRLLVRLSTAIAVAVGAAAVWVALTLATGLTYHLFPAVIAGAPVFVWNLTGPGRAKGWRVVLLAAGLPIVALAWGLLEAMDRTPTATFVEGQPGGVRAEVVLIALLGIALAARLSRRLHDSGP